jgi:hypothetical protein
MEMIIVLKDRYLTIERRRQMKKWIQGGSGSWHMLTATQGYLTRRVIPAPRKGHSHQGQARDNVTGRAPKGRTLERRRLTRQECNNGIKVGDLKEQPQLRKQKSSCRIFKKAIMPDIVKQRFESSVRIQKMSDWTLWRVWPHPKQKKRPTTTA